MKRAANRALAAILSLTLVFSCAGMAFAGNGAPGKENRGKTEAIKIEAVQTAAAAKAASEPASDETAAGVIAAAKNAASSKEYAGEFKLIKVKTGSEKVDLTSAGIVAFDQNEILGPHPNYSSLNIVGHSTKVTVPAKGTVLMAAAADPSNGKSVNFGLFYDREMTKPVGNYYSVSAGNAVPGSGAYSVKVTKAGTYYLGAYCLNGISYPETFANGIALAAAFVSGADRTLTGGTWAAVGQKDAQKNYFKYVPKYTGYAKVDVDGLISGKVTLMNYKKASRSDAVPVYRSPITFGVKKGVTYYIKVDAGSNSSGAYRIKAGAYGITDTSGATKSKARTLSKGVTKKGVIIAGSSTPDWYKIKLTSKRDFKIVMKGGTNKTLKMSVYNSKGKLQKSGTFNYNTSALTYSAYHYPAGTYYVKISRNDDKSSGWYSLNWK